ncbi:MAG: matrixin family metalloprotease [Phycisphaerae bacterium]
MRQFSVLVVTALLARAVVGCAPPLLVAEDAHETDGFNTVLSVATELADTNDDPSAGNETSVADDSSPPAADTSRIFSGNVNGDGGYRLFELGGGSAGDEWVVTASAPMSGPFVVVLLDADENLLMRTFMSYNNPLRHVLRAASGQVYLGIMPPSGGDGGSFRLKATLAPRQPVRAPGAQVVWVNFGAGRNVLVHRRDPISFAPFDGAMVGEAYAARTQEMKDVILQEMRADYAPYNVVITSSDDGPPPADVYSTVHFGGGESGLLGLADKVDSYNQDPAQNAIVYVENFAPYWTMQLEPDEMAVMIANVAGHELGHLLGLYHTQDPEDIMDTTGSAWELAENQRFMRGPLESSVFATGWEDSPRLLAQIVGENPNGAAKPEARQKSAKSATYKAIRRFARQELTCTCGTCLSLDHE